MGNGRMDKRDMIVINEGDKPTLLRGAQQSHIDITIKTRAIVDSGSVPFEMPSLNQLKNQLLVNKSVF